MKNLYDKIHRDFKGLRSWSNDCHIRGMNGISSHVFTGVLHHNPIYVHLIEKGTIVIPPPKPLPNFINGVRYPPW